MGNLLRISPIDLKTHNGKVNIYTMSVVGSARIEDTLWRWSVTANFVEQITFCRNVVS